MFFSRECHIFHANANIYARSYHEETLQRQRAARARQERQRRLIAAEKARKEGFDKRSLVERKTALNLVQLAQVNQDGGLDPDRVENLISTLIVCISKSLDFCIVLENIC